MSQMYDDIKTWVFELPDEMIVGKTNDYDACLIATFRKEPLTSDDFHGGCHPLPNDVLRLASEFDYIDTRGILVTAVRAQELFQEDTEIEKTFLASHAGV